MQVLGLVSVDVVILLLWTYIQRPEVIYFNYFARHLEVDVELNSCSTGLDSPFEQVYNVIIRHFYDLHNLRDLWGGDL